MPQTKQAPAANYITIRTFVEAAIEMQMAEREARVPAVRPSEYAELAAIVTRAQGVAHAEALEALVSCRIAAKIGSRADADTISDLLTDVREALGGADVVDTLEVFIDGRLESLEERNAGAPGSGASPALPLMRYAGVWRAGHDYTPGECVTRDGTLWHCGIPTNSQPGAGSDWQMMHKTFDRKPR